MAAEKYVMPEIHVGDPVLWFHSPAGNEPAAGVVTAVHRGTISVMIFPPESRVGIPKDVVRHASDPQVAKLVGAQDGVWDYTNLTKRILSAI